MNLLVATMFCALMAMSALFTSLVELAVPENASIGNPDSEDSMTRRQMLEPDEAFAEDGILLVRMIHSRLLKNRRMQPRPRFGAFKV